MNIEETPVPLPSAPVVQLADSLTLQPPLTRRGHGPGLVILVPAYEICPVEAAKSLDPPPLQKWAEEGFAVVQIRCTGTASGTWDFAQAIREGLDALIALPECDEKKFGFIGERRLQEWSGSYWWASDYTSPSEVQVSEAISSIAEIECVVSYSTYPVQRKHVLLHLTGENEAALGVITNCTSYQYPEARSAAFVIPGHKDFNLASAGVAHTRSLTFIKKHIGGPTFDLEAIWEEHTAFEFANRSVANTMGTMVQEPYVNHIPTVSKASRTKWLQLTSCCRLLVELAAQN